MALENLPVLKLSNLKVELKVNNQILYPVNEVSVEVHQGEVLGIVGESGCGKTMTALAIDKLLPSQAKIAEESEILLNQQDISKYDEKQMQNLRGVEISFVFQEPMTSLNPVFTIGYQLSEIFMTHFDMNKEEALKKSEEALLKVQLSKAKDILNMYPHELSGGMRQRVMIAMAIAAEPKLLIADEPTTALDVTTQAEIIRLFKDLKNQKRSMIFISHNLMLVKSFCDKIAIMYLGEIVEEAFSEELFENPLHPYTQMLFKAIPQIGNTENLKEIEGQVPSLEDIPKSCCRFYERCPSKMDICIQKAPLLSETNRSTSKHKARCFLYEKS